MNEIKGGLIIVCRDKRILLFKGNDNEYQEWLKDKKNSDSFCMGFAGREALFDALMHGAEAEEKLEESEECGKQ